MNIYSLNNEYEVTTGQNLLDKYLIIMKTPDCDK